MSEGNEVELERMVVRLIGDSKSYMEMMRKAEEETKRAETSLMGMGKKIESVGAQIRMTGLMMSAAITAPLAGIGYAAQSEFTEFEAALSRMEGLVGIAGEEVAQFREIILGLAGPVAKSPVELAKAMEFITGSGIKGKDALETLEITAKAASAGLGETVEVANAVTSALNAYGPANLNAAKATDILVATVREGKAEAASFAPVFGQVLPLAAEMGVTFGEVGGALAFLTRTTGNASIATTQLRSMMTQLMKPTEKSTKALEAMGITGVDVSNMIKQDGLINTLNFLKVKLGEAGLEIKDLIGDTEGLMGALQFTGPQAKIAAEMIKTVNSAAGDTQKAFDAATKTAKFSFAQAMAETKIAMIELGEIIAPVMGQLISYQNMAMQAWKGVNDETKQTIVIFLGVAAVIGPTIVIVGTLVSNLGTLITAYATVKTAVLAYAAANSAAAIASHMVSMNIGILAVGLTALAVKQIIVNDNLKEFNEQLDLAGKLNDRLTSNYQKGTAAVITEAGGMKGEDRTAFLTKEAKKAEVAIDSYKKQIQSAKKVIDESFLNPDIARMMGNANIKLLDSNVVEAETRLQLAEERLATLKAEMQAPQLESQKVGAELKPNKEKFSTKELFEYTQGLQSQLALLQQQANVGQDAADTLEVIKFKAQGASDAQLNLARETNAAIIAQQKQNDVNASAKSLVESLQNDVAGLGVHFKATADEVQIYQLAVKGANTEVLREAHLLAMEKKALGEHKKLMEDGAALKKQYMDPAKKQQEEQEKLSKMLEKGAIDLDTYNKALKDIEKQARKDYTVEFKTSGTEAVAAGSAEALERLREYQYAISGAKPLPIPSAKAISDATQAKALANNNEKLVNENSAKESLAVIADRVKRLVTLAEDKLAKGEVVEFITEGLESL